MRPNTGQWILLSSLIIVLVIMLSSQAMSQSPTNENVTKDAKSDNDNKTSKSENATSNVPSCILEPKDSKAGIVKDSFAVAGLVALIIILAVTFASSRIIRKGRQ